MNNSQTDWSFKLDGVLHNTSQEMVYETVAKDLVCKALQGYNGELLQLLFFGSQQEFGFEQRAICCSVGGSLLNFSFCFGFFF